LTHEGGGRIVLPRNKVRGLGAGAGTKARKFKFLHMAWVLLACPIEDCRVRSFRSD
jgi:hypothetical protein